MESPSGADAATLLMRLLPAEAADRVASLLDPADAQFLRARVTNKTFHPTAADESAALTAFFDLLRITNRPNFTAPPTSANGSTGPQPQGDSNTNDDTLDPVAAIRDIDPAILARALDEEQSATAALVLSRLDSVQVAEIMKRLTPARRSEVAVRLAQTGDVNHVLIERLGRAVLEKAQKLAALPPQPTPEERTRNMAALIRRLGRPERADVLSAIEKADPKAVALIRQEMFRFDDLLKVDDRPLQGLIAELDAKTLALALKGAPDAIAEKILRNTSSRGRQALTDEIALLGNVQKAAIAEAQARVVDVLRKQEEEGKISLES